jgi:uncharacterized repeat protein (TIGR03943 family)
VAWLLVLPVFATFLIAPPALGSYTASRGGTATVVQPTSDFPPLPKGREVPLAMVEYFTRAIWDKGASMKGRNVRLRGFISPRPGGGVYLTRIMLTCCAADGMPIKVGLSGDVPDRLAPDTWVEVVGQYDPKLDKDRANKQSIPFIKVTKLRKISTPKQQYEQ